MGAVLRDHSTSRESYFLDRTPVLVPNVTAYTPSEFNSGKVHIIPDVTANITITLPAAAAGLEYEFIYGGVAADAQNHIIRTASATNFMKGGVVHCDLDAGSGADELIPVFPNGTTNSKLTLVTPQNLIGLKLVCDGTNWFVQGLVCSNTVPTFADLP